MPPQSSRDVKPSAPGQPNRPVRKKSGGGLIILVVAVVVVVWVGLVVVGLMSGMFTLEGRE